MFLANNYRTIGVDLSEEAVTLTNKREGLEGKVRVMDIRNLDFPEGSFNAVWDNASLLHIPEKEAQRVIRGYNRVLAEEGILFVRVKEGEGEVYVEEKVLKGGAYGGEKRFFKFYNLDELRKLLEANGFEILEAGVKAAIERPINWVYAYARKVKSEDSSRQTLASVENVETSALLN